MKFHWRLASVADLFVGHKIMQRGKHPIIRKLLWLIGSFLALCLAAFLIYFPGGQTIIALTLATGIGVSSLQAHIDRLEDEAINGRQLASSLSSTA